MCSFRSLIFTRTSSCGHSLCHRPPRTPSPSSFPARASPLPAGPMAKLTAQRGINSRERTLPPPPSRGLSTQRGLPSRVLARPFPPRGSRTTRAAQCASVLAWTLAAGPQARKRTGHSVRAQAHWAPGQPPPVLRPASVRTASGPQQEPCHPGTSFRSGSILYTDWSWFRSLIAIAIWPP